MSANPAVLAPAVELRGVRFSYHGVGAPFALEIPHFSLAPGERVACIGPSGSGKTTLLQLIAGILTPQAGAVRVGEHEMSRLGDAQRRRVRLARIGLVSQELELIDYLSARDNILLPFRLAGRWRPTRAASAAADELAAATGISDVLRRVPRRLSQGERQRVAICRALVSRPALVLADEPTGNLDERSAAASLELLFDQTQRCGAALLMVTHDRAARACFDRVLELPLAARGGA